MNLRFFATLNSPIDGRWYINGLDTREENEGTPPGNFVEVTPAVYMKLFRTFGRRVRLGHLYNCRYFVMSVDNIVNDINDVHEDNQYSDASSPMDAVDVACERIAEQLRTWIASSTQLFPLALFQYMKANNELAAAGYVITDSNREEKYLEIISNGDVQLIDALAAFLDAQDEMNVQSKMLQIYMDCVRELNKATTVDELKIIYETKIAKELLKARR